MRCTVYLRGMTNDLATIRSVDVELPEGATLRDLIGALARTVPALRGRVIADGEDRLTGRYGLSVNGRYYVDEYDLKIDGSDRILLLAWSLGG